MKRDTILLTTSALLLALLIVGAYVRIPTPWGVPMTLQDLAIMLLSLVLPCRQAMLTVAVYLVTGALGLPVFSGGTGGAACFAGPTGGFLVGFLLMPPFIAAATGGRPGSCGTARLMGACLLGMVPVFLLGASWFAHHGSMSLGAAAELAVLPFLPGNLLKAFVATSLFVHVKRRVPVLAAA